MQIPVLIHTSYFTADKPVLVDSGATNNFMHPKFAKQMRLKLAVLEGPHKIWNADNTKNKEGMITHYLDLDVETKSICKDMRFYCISPILAKKTFFLDTLGLLPMSHTLNGRMPPQEKKSFQSSSVPSTPISLDLNWLLPKQPWKTLKHASYNNWRNKVVFAPLPPT